MLTYSTADFLAFTSFTTLASAIIYVHNTLKPSESKSAAPVHWEILPFIDDIPKLESS